MIFYQKVLLHMGQITMMGGDSKYVSYFCGGRAEVGSHGWKNARLYETVIKIDLPHLDDQVEARQVEAISDRQIVI
jgi:hypothetical protein